MYKKGEGVGRHYFVCTVMQLDNQVSNLNIIDNQVDMGKGHGHSTYICFLPDFFRILAQQGLGSSVLFIIHRCACMVVIMCSKYE